SSTMLLSSSIAFAVVLFSSTGFSSTTSSTSGSSGSGSASSSTSTAISSSDSSVLFSTSGAVIPNNTKNTIVAPTVTANAFSLLSIFITLGLINPIGIAIKDNNVKTRNNELTSTNPSLVLVLLS